MLRKNLLRYSFKRSLRSIKRLLQRKLNINQKIISKGAVCSGFKNKLKTLDEQMRKYTQ